MYKPIYLKPFILVYHIVSWFLLFILSFIKYVFKGSGVTIYLLSVGIYEVLNLLYIFIKYLVKILAIIFKYMVVILNRLIKYIIKLINYIISGVVLTSKFIYKWTKIFSIRIYEGIQITVQFIVDVIVKVIKTLYLILCYIYHLVSQGVLITFNFIKKVISYFIRILNKGFNVTKDFIIKYVLIFYCHLKHGFILSCIAVKRFIFTVYHGFDVYIYYVRRGFTVTYEYIVLKINQYKAYRKRKSEEARQRKIEQTVKKNQIKEEKIRRKLEEKELRSDSYIDETVKLNKGPTFGEKINGVLVSITQIPNKIKHSFSKTTIDKVIKKHNKKVDKFTKDVLDLDLEEETKKKKKENTKILYEYIAKDKNGKTVKGYFEAFNKMEVKSFLVNEGLEVYSIRTNRWITLFHRDTASGKVKFKTKDLVFFLTQLSTYIKAGITLAESLEILSRQFKNKHYQRIIKSLVYDLNLGVNFSEALDKQGIAFPRLLINMVRASEMTGALPEVLDDQADYYDQMEKTRKQMITALMYPSLVFVIAIGVLTFVMLYVVPQFVDIFESMDGAEIPGITIFIMNMSEFLKNYSIWIFVGIIVFAVIFMYLYKNVTLFRRWVQIFAMHIPVFGTVIIYNEVTTFTKTFSSLMSHNVYITDTMNILKKLTNNEIYKDLINKTIDNLSTGERISLAFKDHWAFPVPAYEMLVTGERTGELPEMMGKVSTYYQELHKNSVARIKVFVEPLLIVTLTVLVGLIVLAIVVPMFQMYSSIQQM